MTTSRSLSAVVAGALVSGALLAGATPATAQEACYPARANCVVAPAGVDVVTTYDAASNTVTLTLRGLRPFSGFTITVRVPNRVRPATFTADATGALSGTTTAAASGSMSLSGTADAQGVADVQVPLSSLGTLTRAQINGLVFTVEGTSLDGTPVSSDGGVAAPTGGGDGGSGHSGAGQGEDGASTVASGSALPFTGGDVLPVAGLGALLVLGGGGVLVLSRRKVSAPGA